MIFEVITAAIHDELSCYSSLANSALRRFFFVDVEFRGLLFVELNRPFIILYKHF